MRRTARQGVRDRIALGIGCGREGSAEAAARDRRARAVGRCGSVVGPGDADGYLGEVGQAMGVSHAIGEKVGGAGALAQGLCGRAGVVQGVAEASVRLDGERSIGPRDDGGSRHRLERAACAFAAGPHATDRPRVAEGGIRIGIVGQHIAARRRRPRGGRPIGEYARFRDPSRVVGAERGFVGDLGD